MVYSHSEMLYSNDNDWATTKPQNMDSHKHNADGKMQIQMKIYDSNYIQYKTEKKCAMLLEVKVKVILKERVMTWREYVGGL